MSSPKSFTLIELLIVIGILAVLVAAIVITLNPAQLLQEARDSKRQQDLSALTQALHTITTLDQSLFMGTSSIVYTSLPDSSSTCGSWGLPTLPSGWQYHCSPTSSLQSATGTGWIPVNFKTTGVVSLSSLPTDPINASSSNLYYTYVSGGSFELNGILESTKYRSNPSLSKPNLPGVLSYGSNQALSPLYNTSGLVGYWNFDNNVSDQSGNNNNGTWYGTSTTRYVGGKVGSGAGTFNGTNDYVNAGGTSTFNFGSRDFSISLWAKQDAAKGPGGMVSKGLYYTSPGPGYSLEVISSPRWPWFRLWDGSVGSDRAFVYAETYGWTHMVGVRHNGMLETYTNGLPMLQQTFAGGSLNNDYALTIGVAPVITSYLGSIDDVRVYNRALSASEISALYNATK